MSVSSAYDVRGIGEHRGAGARLRPAASLVHANATSEAFHKIRKRSYCCCYYIECHMRSVHFANAQTADLA